MSASANPLRILVVADDPLARAGLAALINAHPDCEVVGQEDSTIDLPASTAIFRPDVILWDLGWDPAATLEALQSAAGGDRPVVALLSGDAQAGPIKPAGVHGLLDRDAPIDRLAAGLRAAAEGLAVFEPDFLPDSPPAPAPTVESPTPRELEVLQLLAEGLPNKAIARELGISEHTVKFHVNAIMGKLAAQSRTEAVVQATRLGWLSL